MTDAWPSLPLDEWRDTYATLHMWTQVIGKIRLAQAPLVNHWWEVPLYVTCRGLTTSPIAYGTRTFQIDLDFIDHRLIIQTSDGATESLPLQPMSVATFYATVMERMQALGLPVRIWTMPVEIPNPIRFESDQQHASYVPDQACRFWCVLVQVDRVFMAFRSRFIGKVSPVHFFWGSFDLAVTRFSGRPHPSRPDADSITREAYSHECCSCGFWPGGDGIQQPAFYSYAYPEPGDFPKATVRPDAAFYDLGLGQFILPYDAVREAASPDESLLAFLQSAYEAAATLGNWDRPALERTAA
jgi:hypothetical protein